jgi:hypothetical protein
MRSITQAQRDVIADSEGHWTFAYLEVKDYDGTWHNLGALAGGAFDAFNTATLSDDIDKNTLAFSATMLRESGINSLSPFKTESPLNARADFSYSPLLDLHREWRIMVAVVARGITPTIPGDYREMASGLVDRIDIAGDPAIITIQGRGREADLMDAMIANGTRIYGTDDLSEDLGDTLQAMLDDQGFGDVALTFNPAAPAFALNTWTQEETQLLPAMAEAAALAGAVLRYKYSASDVHTLTLFEPNRDATVEDWGIEDTEYERLDVAIDISGVRNYVPVSYVDSTTGLVSTVISPAAEASTITSVAGAATFSATQAGVLENGAIIVVLGVAYVVSAFDGTTGCTLSGVPTFTAEDWHTSASITRYGMRSVPIDLSAETQVVDSASAQSLADNVCADLEFPLIEQSMQAPGLWFAELGDYVKTFANGVHYDEHQYGGVTSLQHVFANGDLVTTLGLRGQPAGRYRTWLSVGGGGASSATPVVHAGTFTFWYSEPLGFPLMSMTATVNTECRSVKFEVSDTLDMTAILFTSETDTNADLTANGFNVVPFADLAEPYYLRITPYSGLLDVPLTGSVTGSPGVPIVIETFAERVASTSSTISVDRSAAGVVKHNIVTSVALPGSPTTTTQSALDGSTRIATTAYVDNAVTAGVGGALLADWQLGHPDATPDSRGLTAAVVDDEFESGSTIDTAGTRTPGATAWTAFNLGSTTTAIARSRMYISCVSAASDILRGYTQPVPTGSAWRRRIKMSWASPATLVDYVRIGLMVRRSSNDSAYFMALGYHAPQGRTHNVYVYTGVTGGNTGGSRPYTGFTMSAEGFYQSWWYEVYGDGTNLNFRISATGEENTFFTAYSPTYALVLGGAPDQIGIVLSPFNADAGMVTDYFRDPQ